MKNDEFIDYCRAELLKAFENTKARNPDDKHKFRTEGLLQAAKLLGIMSSTEINDLFSSEHIKVFGESVEQRRARKLSLTELKENSPDVYFQIPAIERKN